MEHQIELLVDECHRCASIPLVATKRLNARILLRRARQHLTTGHRVGLVGRMHLHMEQIPQGIHDDMALASLHFLMPIYPSLCTGVLRLDALRVDQSVAGRRRLAVFFRCTAVISSRARSHTPRKFQLRK